MKHLIPVSLVVSGSALVAVPLATALAHLPQLEAVQANDPRLEAVLWFYFPAFIGLCLIVVGIFFAFRSYAEK